jgi:acetate kinase
VTLAVFNAGSSSLKFGLYDEDAAELASGEIDWKAASQPAELSLRRAGAADPVRTRRPVAGYGAAVACALEALGPEIKSRSAIGAVGQRVVHGGPNLLRSVRIDAAVKAEISRLTELAPLHNPPALESIDAVDGALPGVPQVAVFDTAFYATLAPAHYVYPLPYEWYRDWGVRRFGFHGVSHAYCAARAREMLEGRGGLRLVSCHLGNGCSATATRDGVAVATTMGFTPLDGLMMGTRPGAVDPGILLYLQERRGLPAAELARRLNHEAGLQGVSGISSDYREVETAARAGNAQAILALEIYALRVGQAIGSLAVTLGGIDALVFTAGVGEHSAPLRAAACQGLECLGLRLDAGKNLDCRPDADVAAADSRGRILVMQTREELMMAREIRQVLSAGPR